MMASQKVWSPALHPKTTFHGAHFLPEARHTTRIVSLLLQTLRLCISEFYDAITDGFFRTITIIARNSMTRPVIGIAMSGGVDSTACALMLKQDYTISGFLMDLDLPDFKAQKERVQRLGEKIGIEIHVVDLKEQFKKKVLEYFTRSYFAGKTPNPCAICNHEIKFGLFMDAIIAAGSEFAATGHYARIADRQGDISLLKGIDPKKDQSYFLSRLSPQQLQRVMFPLGSMIKEDTYRFVESHGFTDFRGRESQDVCFFTGTRLGTFLNQHLKDGMTGGAIVTTSGEEIGRHQGLYHYTIGQRRGLDLPHHSPWYVHTIDPDNNLLIVGKEDELFSRTIRARLPNWLCQKIPEEGETYQVKTRSRHPGSVALIQRIDTDSFELLFRKPERAVTPGQFVVLYKDERVIGSGEIVSPSKSR